LGVCQVWPLSIDLQTERSALFAQRQRAEADKLAFDRGALNPTADARLSVDRRTDKGSSSLLRRDRKPGWSTFALTAFCGPWRSGDRAARQSE
jgi:hypothetical protein